MEEEARERCGSRTELVYSFIVLQLGLLPSCMVPYKKSGCGQAAPRLHLQVIDDFWGQGEHNT